MADTCPTCGQRRYVVGEQASEIVRVGLDPRRVAKFVTEQQRSKSRVRRWSIGRWTLSRRPKTTRARRGHPLPFSL